MEDVPVIIIVSEKIDWKHGIFFTTMLTSKTPCTVKTCTFSEYKDLKKSLNTQNSYCIFLGLNKYTEIIVDSVGECNIQTNKKFGLNYICYGKICVIWTENLDESKYKDFLKYYHSLININKEDFLWREPAAAFNPVVFAFRIITHKNQYKKYIAKCQMECVFMNFTKHGLNSFINTK